MNESKEKHILPITKANRILYLDILRGIAILFIFIANIYAFCGWYLTTNETKMGFPGHQLDTWINHGTQLFIVGKWYSIFSILFGIGFVIQYKNKKSKSFTSFFSRRMLGLLLIGLIHLIFIWWGDILTLYAILGFTLIFFRNLSNLKLLIWAGILLCLPTVHFLIMSLTDPVYPFYFYDIFDSFIISADSLQALDEKGNYSWKVLDRSWLDTESWYEMERVTLIYPLNRIGMILEEGRMFKVLACFLIGIWVGRKILYQNLLDNKLLIKKIALWGFVIGIPMNVLLVYLNDIYPYGSTWYVAAFIPYALGVVPLAAAYMASIAILVKSKRGFLHYFAPIGRMALSNYIFQSIIAILIFYGVGFGLAFDLPLWQVILITIGIFCGQIVFSTFWLIKFKFGPLEWIWRMMTYGKIIPNRN